MGIHARPLGKLVGIGFALAAVVGSHAGVTAAEPSEASQDTDIPDIWGTVDWNAPVVWNAPWPQPNEPAAGYPVLGRVEHFRIFRSSPETGTYNHHSHLFHDGQRFYALWSNHDHGEDGPGQRVLGSISRDGRAWTAPFEVFPARGPVQRSEQHGRVMTANGWVPIDGMLYAVGEVHDNVGFTDAAAHKVVSRRSPLAPMRARRGWGRMARSVSPDGELGLVFWLIDDPPRPRKGFSVLPRAMDSRFRHQARLINGYLEEPLNMPYWDFLAASIMGFHADMYDRRAADGHYLVEPTTYRRPDGTYVRLFRDRNHSHRLYATSSADGATWLLAVPTNIPDSPSRTHSGRLPDGRVFLLGNQISDPLEKPDKPRHYRRDPLVISTSDDGKSFAWAAAVRSGAPPLRHKGKGKGAGFHYPFGTVVGDSLWIMYSVGKEDIEISRVPIAALGRRDN
jgi:hypothetical protein